MNNPYPLDLNSDRALSESESDGPSYAQATDTASFKPAVPANDRPGSKRRGRPPTDIFNINRKKRGLPPSNLDLKIRAWRVSQQHMLWTHIYYTRRSNRLKSAQRRAWGYSDERLELYVHIERAMIVMGMKGPHPYDKRPYGLERYWPFDDEAVLFWHKTRKIVEEHSPHRKGPKLNPEKLFRTALATLVARKLLQPKGGNWRSLPSPRQIAQVWYVIFEEEESYVNIRNRLKVVGRLCYQFEYYYHPTQRDLYYFNKLGRALRAKYGK